MNPDLEIDQKEEEDAFLEEFKLKLGFDNFYL